MQLAAGASVVLHEFDGMTNSPLFDAMLMPVSGAPPALTSITLCDALDVLIIWRGNFSDVAERAAYGFVPPIPYVRKHCWLAETSWKEIFARD